MEGIAKALHRALHWEPEERKIHMAKLREQIRRNNIFRWVDSFLRAGIAKSLVDFPEMETVQFDRA
jgi:trehalose 6-phosphate synthase